MSLKIYDGVMQVAIYEIERDELKECFACDLKFCHITICGELVAVENNKSVVIMRV